MGAAHPRRSTLASLIAIALFTGGLLLPSTPALAATINVTTSADEYNEGSACSLREASVAASTDEAFGGCSAGSGDDTIMVPASVYVLDINGCCENESEEGDIDFWTPAERAREGEGTQQAVTVQGAGLGSTIIDGGDPDFEDRDRVFHVTYSHGSATFADLTIRNGLALGKCEWGGGIYAGSGEEYTVTVLRSSVHKNDACGNGAGIASGNGTNLAVTDSVIANNHALSDDSDGGGIYADGDLTILNSTVADNTAYDYGGGIKAWQGGEVTITNSTISGNEIRNRRGGGAYFDTFVTITDSTIEGNSSAFEGGGLYIDDCDCSVDISDTTISNNKAQHGGGIYNSNCCPEEVRAEQGGFGVTELTNVTISSNFAYNNGGGVYNDAFMAMNHTTVYRNVAQPMLARGEGLGGCVSERGSEGATEICSTGGGIYDNSNTTYYTNSIIAGNEQYDCGGAGFFSSSGGNFLGDLSCPNDSGGPDTDVYTELGPIDPRLAPLQNNGGPTKTHALLSGSLAIDNADGLGPCPAMDQRGLTRPTGADCDSGAYEVGDLPGTGGGPTVGGEVIVLDLRCRKKDPTIVGTPGDDKLTGTPGVDVIQGREGKDTISGLGGDDIICGARGNDEMKGGAGDDVLKGHRGVDHYLAGSGKDLCIPGPGDDVYKDCETPPQTT